MPELPDCTTVENVGTGNNWKTATTSNFGTSSKALNYSYNYYNPANTWFYTQEIQLEAGVAYRLTFNYVGSGYNESLKVKYGTS
ncbi:MAG: hypothetical protein PHW82_15120, partial [Bacteroidales bacterium]|nr:hypothetical protein [Bacteroidales bacterium]